MGKGTELEGNRYPEMITVHLMSEWLSDQLNELLALPDLDQQKKDKLAELKSELVTLDGEQAVLDLTTEVSKLTGKVLTMPSPEYFNEQAKGKIDLTLIDKQEKVI